MQKFLKFDENGLYTEDLVAAYEEIGTLIEDEDAPAEETSAARVVRWDPANPSQTFRGQTRPAAAAGRQLPPEATSPKQLAPQYTLPQGITDVDVPQDTGFYHPKWNGEAWVEGLTEEEISDRALPPPPNWKGLETALRGTELFAKAYGTSKSNPAVQTAFFLFMNSVTTTHDLEDLAFSLGDLVTELGEVLSQEDKESVNQKLADNQFEPLLPV